MVCAMQNFIIDMGYAEFARREELKLTLSYSAARGLLRHGEDWLLWDYSLGQKFSAHEILVKALALSRRVKSWTNKPRIGLLIPPSFHAAVCNYACAFAGVIPVNMNFTMGAVAAQSCVETSGIDAMVSCAKFKEKISAANPSYPWSETVVDLGAELQSIGAAQLEEISAALAEKGEAAFAGFGIERDLRADKEATLVFTSGSEGAPKAAVLTQKNIVANSLQVGVSEVFEEGDVLLANLPIFHCFGQLFEVWYMALAGQKTVSLNSPLDIKSNIRAIKESGASVMIGSPTFFRAYLKHAAPEDLRSLKKAIAGAEKTPDGFHELWDKTFGLGTYREGYGLTETTPVVGVNLKEKDFGYFSTGARKKSIGKLFAGMQARVLDISTLEPLPFGAQGLLSMRGPNVFAGYLNNPAASAKTLRGEWLITGDLARIDADGFLYIDGRLSRFSKIGGEMVPHATVESALNIELGYAGAELPQIAVSARLDDSKGEALVLLCVENLELHEVKEALRRAGISNLWHPKHIVKVDKIPLLPSGKFDLPAIASLAKA